MAEARSNAAGQKAPPGGKRKGRVIERAKARVTCRFGANGADRTGFTKNVSETGLFLKTNQVFPPGTTIHVTLQFPDREFAFWATVVWAKKVPPNLAHILECGMGVRFIEPTPEWLAYYESWKHKFVL
jgi:uncharacterized protein (TIGR02266 family)